MIYFPHKRVRQILNYKQDTEFEILYVTNKQDTE